MQLSKEEVRRLAEQSRLRLTDEEIDMFSRQLSDVLGMIDEMMALETNHIQRTVTVSPATNRVRDDDVRPSWAQDEVLSNATETADGQFKVPSVFEG